MKYYNKHLQSINKEVNSQKIILLQCEHELLNCEEN